jgi:hypothetical protein
MLILKWWRQFLGALTFYTVIPIPATWQPEFGGIARWSPLVGLFLGGGTGGARYGIEADRVSRTRHQCIGCGRLVEADRGVTS